jgi:hypothetical protein
MHSSFTEAVEWVHAMFSKSEVLRQLGYGTCSREVPAESPFLPATCHFAMHTSGNRRLVISFCYGQDGNHFFTVEVFNTTAASSFLLEEWLSQQGVKLEPYPFILSSYAGTPSERLTGFVSFLDSQLSTAEMADVLGGRGWLNIPFDWGSLK